MPAKKEEEFREEPRVATGIPGLDELIEGGFERHSVVLVAGEAGSGKSTFALQFLYNGATKFGEPGLYITFEEQKRAIFRHYLRFGWNFPELEKQKKISVAEYPPHEVDKFISEGGIIEDLIRDNDIQRVAIDSMTSFALLYENEYKRRSAFLKAMEQLRRWGCTTLLTSEAEATRAGELRVRFGMEFLTDGFIAIHTIRKGDVRDSALEVVKLRGTEHVKRLVPLKITKTGIVVYPNQPVFGEKAF
ncbi:MAG: ATPase domain-containing protein [Candidatus Micrarchaeia archaeon]